jgi:hypothetical protein
MYKLDNKQLKKTSELLAVEQEPTSKPTLPLEKFFDKVLKSVTSLYFKDKKQVIRKLVTEIAANKKEIVA